MALHRFSGMPSGVSLRCRGCNKGVTATSFRAGEFAEMLGWRRDEAGDWCVTCQWRRGMRPRFVDEIVGRAAGRPG